MRGFGSVHPTVGELRYGSVPVRLRTNRAESAISARLKYRSGDDCQRESGQEKAIPITRLLRIVLWPERHKAICMGILDRAMRSPDTNSPSNDQEFVLYHTEGIESMGFTNHLKLPHYVTFQAGLSNVRAAVDRNADKRRL